jgi:SAM-dependent methyltransferase
MFSFIEFAKEVYGGKTLGRIIFNNEVALGCKDVKGVVADLATGEKPSYYKFLPKDLDIKRADYIKKTGADEPIDLNKPLPFLDNTFDAIFLFNAIYILNDPNKTLVEIKRILKIGGKLYLSSPFSNIETPEPHDFRRYTMEGLEVEFNKAGFKKVSIKRYGDRFSSAVNLITPFIFFKTLRLIAYSVALTLDKMIPQKIKNNHPAPLGYFCVVEK